MRLRYDHDRKPLESSEGRLITTESGRRESLQGGIMLVPRKAREKSNTRWSSSHSHCDSWGQGGAPALPFWLLPIEPGWVSAMGNQGGRLGMEAPWSLL